MKQYQKMFMELSTLPSKEPFVLVQSSTVPPTDVQFSTSPAALAFAAARASAATAPSSEVCRASQQQK
jgi:hypothetical protein